MVLITFEEQYTKIKNLVKEDFDILENEIGNLFQDKNPLNEQLYSFLTAPAKRLRPLLGFLFFRCIFNNINKNQHDVLQSVELIHNATLIHDDVIDDAPKRRGQETLNIKFDNNLAVVAGDYLLSLAMEKIINTSCVEVIKLCTSALKLTCIGEISQYFNKFNITSIDEYIEKSKEKTALLFQTGLLGCLLLCEKEYDQNLIQTVVDFSQNFGIAFQIRDDLINIMNADNIVNNDINCGIYTAPVIYAYQENQNILKEENILKALNSTRGIEKTKDLMDNYFDASINAIKSFEDNVYKQALLDLIEMLRANL